MPTKKKKKIKRVRKKMTEEKKTVSNTFDTNGCSRNVLELLNQLRSIKRDLEKHGLIVGDLSINGKKVV